MEFHVNHPVLFIIAGLLVAVVLAQSVYFLVKALRRSKQLGMNQKKLRKTMISAAIFTIAPAVAIVISVMVLSKTLGLPLPWLRLSVVGSMSYETVAANNALSAMGQTLGAGDLTAQQFVNVLIVMTISIMLGIWLVHWYDRCLPGLCVLRCFPALVCRCQRYGGSCEGWEGNPGYCHFRSDPCVRHGCICAGDDRLRLADEAAENEVAQRIRPAHQLDPGHGCCHSRFRMVRLRRCRYEKNVLH